jgi:hypothetical protein
MKWGYIRNGHSFPLTTTWSEDELDYIAQEAAKDFHENHDGWEAQWPISLTLTADGEEKGTFDVELELEPVFMVELRK